MNSLALALILAVVWIISWGMAIVCEKTADRLINIPRWRKTRLVSIMLDTTRVLGVFGFFCAVGSLFIFLVGPYITH